jgi:hypothetical protein
MHAFKDSQAQPAQIKYLHSTSKPPVFWFDKAHLRDPPEAFTGKIHALHVSKSKAMQTHAPSSSSIVVRGQRLMNATTQGEIHIEPTSCVMSMSATNTPIKCLLKYPWDAVACRASAQLKAKPVTPSSKVPEAQAASCCQTAHVKQQDAK